MRARGTAQTYSGETNSGVTNSGETYSGETNRRADVQPDPKLFFCAHVAARRGAVATFAGVVRPTSKTGRSVTELDYEAYEAMAVEKLQQCLDEAAARWTLIDLAVVHRLGHLVLGDVAVSIAVSSAHRAEAFEACRYVIDRIKEIVPIWKKETGPDGVEWVSEGA